MRTIQLSPAREAANRLIDGRTYRARTYRGADAENPPVFTDIALYVQKHKEQVVTVTTRGYDWAEMDPRQEAHVDGGMLRLMAEDYYLDIELSSIDAGSASSDA